jgi:hypothetical protein
MKIADSHLFESPPAGARPASRWLRTAVSGLKRYGLKLSIVALLAAPAPTLSAAPATNLSTAPAHTNAPAPAGTNTVKLIIPVAVFDVTNAAVKDPFFPLSARRAVPSAVTNAPVAVNSSLFLLKGLSGGVGRRLALINNRTLAVGEDAEVTTSAGRFKIRCLEIKDDSVVIHVEKLNGTLVLRLRAGY